MTANEVVAIFVAVAGLAAFAAGEIYSWRCERANRLIMAKIDRLIALHRERGNTDVEEDKA